MSALLVASAIFASGAPTANAVDQTRLIVRLTPPVNDALQVKLGNTGRREFDRAVADIGVIELRQVFPPLRPPHRLYNLSRSHGMQDFVVLKLSGQVDPDSARSRLAALPDVVNAEFDAVGSIVGYAITPNDPYFFQQWALRNDGTQPTEDPGTAGADIDMEGGWESTTGDSTVIVAIVDTGIDWDHPELQAKIWVNRDEIACDEFVDNDGNGYPGDYLGWNFVSGTCNSDDDMSHGSMVAGIVGAETNNGIGMAGMDWKCRLMAVKALDSQGDFWVSGVAEALYYAANNGANVINCSWAFANSEPALTAAVDYVVAGGVTVCAAIGNQNDSTKYYPQVYSNVIAVGGTDTDDLRACPFHLLPNSGSTYGSWIDVCAPGDYVGSTGPGGTYWYGCGTSFAAPHVAGLASLVKALRPDFTPAQVQDIIQRGAEDQVGRPEEDTPGFDIYHGWGRINARITLQALALTFPPIITVPGAQTVTEGQILTFDVSAFDSNLTDPSLSYSPLLDASFIDHGDGHGTYTYSPSSSSSGVYTVEFVASDGTLSDTGMVTITVLDGCACDCHCDPAACDGVQDVLDVVQVINVAFRGQAATPDPNGNCPCEPTDVDSNHATDVIDVTKMINVAFRGMDAAAQFVHPCP